MTETGDDDLPMWGTKMDAVLSRWFTTYEAARISREAEGGYLLPYRGQFVVTTEEGIRGLGLDPADPDWARIGWDWVQPLDAASWERLRDRRALAL